MFIKTILMMAYYLTMAVSSPISQRPQIRTNQQTTRSRRNVDFETLPLPNYELWTEDLTNIQFPPRQYFEHIPDFNGGLGLDFDPLLIRSSEDAKRIATFLYSKGLFFGDIPHFQLVLKNQEDRKLNGLAPHRLGSIRIHSPFDISDQRV